MSGSEDQGIWIWHTYSGTAAVGNIGVDSAGDSLGVLRKTGVR